MLQLASINAVPEVADLRRQINEKEAEFAAVKERYMYKHIKYKEAESNLAKLQAALRTEVGNAADLTKASYQAALDNENRLATALHDQENDALALDKTAIPYNALHAPEPERPRPVRERARAHEGNRRRCPGRRAG